MTSAAKFKPPAKWKHKGHHHGCTSCHLRYRCNCDQLDVDGICVDCRMGRRTFIQEGNYPKECCASRRLVQFKEDRERYKLAGPGPWWICPTCCRQFTSPGSNS